MENTDWNDYLSQNMVPMSELTDSVVKELRELDDPAKANVFSTGIAGLDKYMRFAPSQLTLLAGRTNSGKTAMASQMMSSVLRQMEEAGTDGYVGFFSAEMDAMQIAVREACRGRNVDSREVMFETGKSNESRDEVIEYIRQRDWSRLLIDQTSSPTIEHMMEQVQQWSEQGPLRLIVFDYVQLAGEVNGNEALRVAEVIRMLKALAKKFSCPVLALHQLSRDQERRQDKRPKMSDLMFGGEQPADFILSLAEKPDDDTFLTEGGKLMELHVIKARFAERGVFLNVFMQYPGLEFTGADIQRVELSSLMEWQVAE
jgi:replicative DNA helicase